MQLVAGIAKTGLTKHAGIFKWQFRNDFDESYCRISLVRHTEATCHVDEIHGRLLGESIEKNSTVILAMNYVL